MCDEPRIDDSLSDSRRGLDQLVDDVTNTRRMRDGIPERALAFSVPRTRCYDRSLVSMLSNMVLREETMERRTLFRIGIQFAAVAALPKALSAQSSNLLIPALYLADKYIAPPDAPSSVVIAGPGEPGERLVVTGRVLDGRSPITGVSIYAFHADMKGLYERDGLQRGLDPRLFGAMRSDESGRYRYE